MNAPDFLAALQEYLLAWGVVLGVLTTFELASPREHHGLRHRAAGVMFWVISITFSLLLAKVLAALWRLLGATPLLSIPSFETTIGHPLAAALVAGVTAAIVHDFFFYWYHRAQHRWLWRWHAVHHSVRHLNAVNSYHHISEGLFSLVLIQVPMTLLVSEIGPTLPIVTAVLWCHIVWIHSPTRITLGPLRALLVDNRYHRIHHSLEERHFDKNFGAFTTMWDRLFGTYHRPADDEWPAVGLADVPEPQSLVDWIDMPARIRRATVMEKPLGTENAVPKFPRVS